MSLTNPADWTAPTRADLDAEETAETMVAEHVTCFDGFRQALSIAVALIDDGEPFPLGWPLGGCSQKDVVAQLREWIDATPDYPRDARALIELSAHAHDVARTL